MLRARHVYKISLLTVKWFRRLAWANIETRDFYIKDRSSIIFRDASKFSTIIATYYLHITAIVTELRNTTDKAVYT